MTQAETLSKEIDVQAANVAVLQKLWASLFPVESPGAHQMHLWLTLHSLNLLVLAFRETAKANCRHDGQMSQIHLVRFVSKVANERKRRS
jgi:hypothetical protein